MKQPFSGALSRWNYYRESAGLRPVAADPKLSEAARSHSKYLVKNHIEGADAFIENGTIHDGVANPGVRAESPGNPWYSEAGQKAAETAYVIRMRAIAADGAPIVDAMISRGFNAVVMLDPQITAIGYGQYCDESGCVVTISSKWGLTHEQFLSLYDVSRFGWNPALGEMPFTRARLRRPIYFPSPSTPAAASFDGASAPNPQTSCGYTGISGPPIVFALGAPASGGNDVLVSGESISDGGVQIDSCAFDATSYRNPDGYQQRIARWLLHQYGAVMILPRKPLKPGHMYTASITADGTAYEWKFTVAPDAK